MPNDFLNTEIKPRLFFYMKLISNFTICRSKMEINEYNTINLSWQSLL